MVKVIASALLLSSAVGTAANAAPKILECMTGFPPAARGRTYQIRFDESNNTVIMDDGEAIPAHISETIIKWFEQDQYGGATWVVNRATGTWRIDRPDSNGVGGTCIAPPQRKF